MFFHICCVHTVRRSSPIAVPGEPKRVRVETVNSTAIRVMWNPPNKDEQNGIIRGYQLYYQQVDSSGETAGGQPMMHDVENRTETDIGGLLPETRYQFSVSAYTRKGDGSRSRPKPGVTKGASKYGDVWI